MVSCGAAGPSGCAGLAVALRWLSASSGSFCDAALAFGFAGLFLWRFGFFGAFSGVSRRGERPLLLRQSSPSGGFGFFGRWWRLRNSLEGPLSPPLFMQSVKRSPLGFRFRSRLSPPLSALAGARGSHFRLKLSPPLSAFASLCGLRVGASGGVGRGFGWGLDWLVLIWGGLGDQRGGRDFRKLGGRLVLEILGGSGSVTAPSRMCRTRLARLAMSGSRVATRRAAPRLQAEKR